MTSAGFVTEVVDLFIKEGNDEIETMRASIETGDAQGLHRGAHRLKGSALNLGCAAVARSAQELESLAGGGTIEGAGVIIDRLADEFDRTAAVLRIQAAQAA